MFLQVMGVIFSYSYKALSFSVCGYHVSECFNPMTYTTQTQFHVFGILNQDSTGKNVYDCGGISSNTRPRYPNLELFAR